MNGSARGVRTGKFYSSLSCVVDEVHWKFEDVDNSRVMKCNKL